MALEKHIIELQARDQLSPALQKVSKEAERAGRAGEAAGKRASKSMTDWDRAASGLGRGLGVLAVASVKMASDQDRLAVALKRNYGEAADEFQDFADAIQKTTIFSDDQVISGANVAAQLSRNFQFTNEQIKQVIATAADLASIYGTDLASAVDRVVAGLRGEAESAEMIGLSLGDASTGVLQLGGAVTEAEKAQLRFNALVEQGAYAKGSAVEVAALESQGWKSWANTAQDAMQSVGSAAAGYQAEILALGAASQVLGPLGDAFSALDGKAKIASLSSKVMASAWMGPVGLAVGAAAVGAAIYTLIGDHDDLAGAAERAAQREEALGASLGDLADRLREVGLLSEAQAGYDYFEKIAVGAEAAEAKLQEANTDLREFESLTLTVGQSTAVLDGNVIQLTNSTGGFVYQLGEAISNALYLNGALDDGVVTTAEMEAAQARLAAGFDANAETMEAYGKAFTDAMSLASDPRYNGSEIIKNINYVNQAVASGAMAEEEGLAALVAITAGRDKYNITLRQATLEQERLNRAEQAQLGYLPKLTAATDHQNRAEEAQLTTSRAASAAKTAEVIAYLHATKVSGEHGDALTRETAAAWELATTVEASSGGLNDLVDSQFQARDAAAAAEAEMVAQLTALRDFAQAAADASTSTAVLDGAIRTILGGTGDLTGGIEQVNTALSGLMDASDGWSTLDQLVYENRITWDEYNAAVKATTDTQFNANEALLDSATIQAKLAPTLAELAWKQGLYVDEISRLPAAEQMVALAYMDSARAAQALEIQTQLAAAAAGQLGDKGVEATSELVRGVAEADPVMAALLQDMKLISIGADGRITVNVDEAGQSEIAALTASIDALTLAMGGTPPFKPEIDTSEVDEGIAYSLGLIDKWSGTSGTAGAALDTSAVESAIGTITGALAAWDASSGSATAGLVDYASGTLSAIGSMLSNLDGRTATTYLRTVNVGFEELAMGGVVGSAADGGLRSDWTMVGEHGPELVHLPYGSLVTPHGGSQGRKEAKGGGDGIHFHGPVTIVTPDPRSFAEQMREYARAGR